MKKTMLILTAIALTLILTVAGLFAFLLSGLNTERRTQSLEVYLAAHWKIFQLRAWDEKTGTLELDYPLRFSYAQMEEYGATLEELRELPSGNLATVASLKTAAWEAAGVRIRSVTVYGLTNDGKTAYTVWPDGTITACWESENGT